MVKSDVCHIYFGGVWMVNQKHHLTNWGMVCKSKDSGGLGIPNLKYE